MNESGLPSKPLPLLIHGWTVFGHPLFLAQLEALMQQVEALKQKDPGGYLKKNAAKRLAAISRLAFDVIPQDPTHIYSESAGVSNCNSWRGGMVLIARSAMAVMESAGFTPGFAEIIAPSHTNIF